MEQIFTAVLRMSVTASWVIAAVLAIRLLLRRAPKKFSYWLWAAVGFRLCCPVTWTSPISLFRLREMAASGVAAVTAVQTAAPPISAATDTVTAADAVAAAAAPQTAAPQIGAAAPAAAPAVGADPMQILLTVGIALWCAGIAALIVYSVVSYVRMHRRMATAIRLWDNVYESDQVRSPFILGFFRPKIYIPFGLDYETRRYVLAHEGYHLRRGDQWIRAAAFVLLAIHWFNPLCWLAFFYMGKDMEMSCDEKVLSDQNSNVKHYSMSLLSFAINRRIPTPSPLAFGETGVKSRVRNVLRWKQPKVWVTVAALVICLLTVAACSADPARQETPAEPAGTAQQADADDPMAQMVGAYRLSDTVGGVSAGEIGELETLGWSSMQLYLNEGGAGTIVVEDQEIPLTWDAGSVTFEDGESDRMTYDSGTITIEQDDLTLIFTRLSEEAPAEQDDDTSAQQEVSTEADAFLTAAQVDAAGYAHPVKTGMDVYVDLDGDGVAEQFCSDAVQKEYDWEVRFYIGGEERLSQQTYGSFASGTYYIVDLDAADPYLEVAIVYGGDSDWWNMTLFRYDGEKLTSLGELYFTGFGGTESPSFHGDGTVTAEIKFDVLQSWYTHVTYELQNGQIVRRAGELVEPILPDTQKVTLTAPLTVYTQPDLNADTMTLEPSDQALSFPLTDANEWVQVRCADGTTGWAYFEDGYMLKNGDTMVEATEVFDGLVFFG